VVIESLLAGTPAISTACNGASEWLEGAGFEPRGRVIADPADDAALAAAMTELCDEPMRARCRASIEAMAAPISMREHVDRLEAVLEEAAGC
jgi:glycosyltransferase involved in cell wall biosynthesis